jgi:membrane protease YdiL (CAAX protease family)
MLDEAVLDHKPQSILTLLLIFYLVYFIGEIVSTVILLIPSSIWMLTYDGFIEAVREYTNLAMEGNKDTTILTNLINEMSANMPQWLNLVSIISVVGLGAAAIFYCKKFEKRPISSLGIRKKGAISEAALGLIIGGVLISLTVLLAILTGSASIELNEAFSIMIALFFISFLISAFAEVVVFYGYFTTSIARDYKISVAITVGAVLFSLLHSASNEVNYLLLINTILFGVLLGIYVFKRGDIWGITGILCAWNFGGACVFGAQTSGATPLPTLYTLVLNEQKSLANGGSAGIEGGLCTTVVLLIALSLVFLLKTKKGEESLSDAIDFE